MRFFRLPIKWAKIINVYQANLISNLRNLIDEKKSHNDVILHQQRNCRSSIVTVGITEAVLFLHG